MSVLIWTRALEDWDEDQKLFVGRETQVMRLPCIATTSIDGALPQKKSDVFVFTSANAVRYAALNPSVSDLMRGAKRIYAIGPSTLKALEDVGVRGEVPPGVKGASDLGDWLSKNINPPQQILWPAADEPSFDLAGYLSSFEIYVEHLAVYQTTKKILIADGAEPDVRKVAEMVERLSGVVCFASPSALKGFVQTLKPRDNRLKGSLIALCIGTTTSKACAGNFDQIQVIDEPRVDLLAEIGFQKLTES